MTEEREIRIGGNICPVTISDDQKTLLAAKAAGRVVVGYLHDGGDQDLPAAEYLIDTPEAADSQYLERVARRHLGLPWMIGESDRLIIREFTLDDIPKVAAEPGDLEPDTVFYTSSRLKAYIESQYRFYEYGTWAVIRKADGTLVGKAGVCNAEDADCLELGYHIFLPYRRKGYAVEACRIILDYVKRELECPVHAVTDPANTASAGVLAKLGFAFIRQRYSESGQLQYLYGWNC